MLRYILALGLAFDMIILPVLLIWPVFNRFPPRTVVHLSARLLASIWLGAALGACHVVLATTEALSTLVGLAGFTFCLASLLGNASQSIAARAHAALASGDIRELRDLETEPFFAFVAAVALSGAAFVVPDPALASLAWIPLLARRLVMDEGGLGYLSLLIAGLSVVALSSIGVRLLVAGTWRAFWVGELLRSLEAESHGPPQRQLFLCTDDNWICARLFSDSGLRFLGPPRQ